MGGFLGSLIVLCIPILGLILAIVWAVGGCRNQNRRNLARAWIVLMVLGVVLGLVTYFAAGSALNKLAETYLPGYTQSDGRSGTSDDGLLGGLLGGGSSPLGGLTEDQLKERGASQADIDLITAMQEGDRDALRDMGYSEEEIDGALAYFGSGGLDQRFSGLLGGAK